jgi:hypothetical protein
VLDDKNAANGAKIGDLSIVYSFRSANSRDKPIVERLSIALRSPEAMRGRPMKTKIQPPAGYEHISLEPIVGLPTQSPEETTKEPDSGSKPDFASAGSGQGSSPGHTGNLPWQWLILTALFLALTIGIVVNVLKTRRRQQTPEDTQSRSLRD